MIPSWRHRSGHNALRVSVVLATYNGENFLQDQLVSIADQTRTPDELIVCDDCSADSTIEILEQFKRIAPFDVQIYRNPENIGYARNFEQAIGLATGDFVFLCDQDDFWNENKISTMIDVLLRDKADVALCDTVLAYSDLTPSDYTQLQALRLVGYPIEDYCAGCCLAFCARIRPLILPLPSHFFTHDVWINSLANALGIKSLVDRPLQLYRRHGANASPWNLSEPALLESMQLQRSIELAKSPLDGWRSRVARVHLIEERLASSSQLLIELGLSRQAEKAKRKLARELRSIEERINVIRLSPWRRWPKVLQMLYLGDYRCFSGWKSAAKDIIRPPM
jgi:glycosyltransferase involved in cell wall biosynthesis